MVGNWDCLSPQRQPVEWLKGNVIGSGSFGTVHLAVDSATGALFVIKSARSVEGGIIALKNEANILENLDSPYIVKFIGKDDAENGETRLFFEYMAGGSLWDLIQKFGGSLNEKVIRVYTRQILRGLKYLHNKRIVHSDVKCKNILLDASGNLKVADFGCAKRLIIDDNEKLNTKCCNGIGGTPLWMAPEVLRNEELDFVADIWSVGCTIIEMATGKPPWGSRVDTIATLLKIATGNELPEFPQHFSPEGIDFLSKCLERDPQKRWTTEKLLDHPFVAGKVTASRKEDVAALTSPTSVLDIATYDSSDDHSSDDDDDNEFVTKIPFSMKHFYFQQKKCPSQNILEASDNWITVRTTDEQIVIVKE